MINILAAICVTNVTMSLLTSEESTSLYPQQPTMEFSPLTLSLIVPSLDSIIGSAEGRMLEIGGPTDWLSNIYEGLEGKVDNVVRDVSDGYERRGGDLTVVDKNTAGSREALVTEIPYTYNGITYGKTYLRDGSDLVGFKNSTYDFLISSHNLEHFINPMKALFEWDRVLKPDGRMMIIVPWHERTYDYYRAPNTFMEVSACALLGSQLFPGISTNERDNRCVCARCRF